MTVTVYCSPCADSSHGCDATGFSDEYLRCTAIGKDLMDDSEVTVHGTPAVAPSVAGRSAVSASGAPGRPVRTVGVEEELLLVDGQTMQLKPAAGEILHNLGLTRPARDHSVPFLEFEAKHEQLEVVSPPLHTLDGIFTSILRGRRAADSAARTIGARAVALGTAPLPCSPHLVALPRYQRMQEHFGITMDEQLTCGFHVHVAVESEVEGVAVLDRIRPWLPIVLALSANSPYWHGVDTGYASYRYQAWCRWPSAGAYDVFGSPEAYHRQLDDMLATEVSLDTGMVYFDARLSQHAPTVETRIADVCLCPRDAAVLAVLIRALVETAAAEWAAGTSADPTSAALLRLASWRASRFGLAGTLIHPRTGRPVPAVTAVRALLGHVNEHFSTSAEKHVVRRAVQRTVRNGTGAARQREFMAAHGSCVDVIRVAAGATIGE
jgi:carboxylate-amine ligase